MKSFSWRRIHLTGWGLLVLLSACGPNAATEPDPAEPVATFTSAPNEEMSRGEDDRTDFRPVAVRAPGGLWPVEIEYTIVAQQQPDLDSDRTTSRWVFRGESWGSWTDELISGGFGSAACTRFEDSQLQASFVGCDGPFEDARDAGQVEIGVNPHVRGHSFTAAEAATMLAAATGEAHEFAAALGLEAGAVGVASSQGARPCGDSAEFLGCEPDEELLTENERVYDLASGLQLREREWVNGRLIHEFVVHRVVLGQPAG